jgi:PAS domain S-box-containing protein
VQSQINGDASAPPDANRYAVVVTDPTGIITSADGPALLSIASAEAQLLGSQLTDVLSLEPLRARAARALSGQTERLHLNARGVELDVLLEPRRAAGAADEGVVLIAVETDGHEKRRSGVRRLQELGLKLVFRQIPGTVWTTDRDLRVTSIEGREPNAIGVVLRDLVGRTVQDFVGSPDPSNPIIAHHLLALAGQSTSFRHEIRGNFYEVRIEPLRDESVDLIGTVGVAVNVTERRDGEVELAKNRSHLLEAQRLAHVGSWEWCVDSNKVEWSEELHRIYGIEGGAFQGTFEAFLALVDPADLETTRRVILETLSKRQPIFFQHRIRRASDGAIRMVQTRGDVVLDDQGKVVRLAGSCWDITEQWQTSEQLERTASLLRATLDATTDGILVIDRKRRVAAYNKTFLAIWGISQTNVLGADDEALLNSARDKVQDGEHFARLVRELYALPAKESFDVLQMRDGRIVERFSVPQRLNGDIIGRVWSFRDVTDREEVLRRAEFLADAGRMLASLDAEKALEGVARRAVPYLGDACAVDLLTDSGGPRRLLVVQRDPSQPLRPATPVAVLSGHPVIQEVDSLHYMSIPLRGRGALFGVLTVVAGNGRRYKDSDLALGEELARRISLAIENANLYRDVEKALTGREEFLSIAAHELRGPTTSIHLSVQGLRRVPLSSKGAERLLEIIEREDRRLTQLVDELLDITRIRSDRLHFDLQNVDLVDVTHTVAARLSGEVAQSGSSLSLSSTGSITGMWDRMRLDQVVTNVLSNAIKFGRGKPIEVSLTATTDEANFTVRDHGIGIESAMLEKIFDPFTRAVSSRHYGGLGLGLYIVRTIVEGLGGRVEVESKAGEETRFSITLPRLPRT